MGWYHKLLHKSLAFYVSATLGLVALAVLGYIYLVPFVAEKSVNLIPEEFDQYISQDFITDYIIGPILLDYSSNYKLFRHLSY